MNDYLISRPGRPLHLAVHVYDRPSRVDYYPTGRHVPLCGQDRGRKWKLTGPYAEKWEQQRKAGVCFRCDVLAASLVDAADAARRAGDR